MKIRTIVLATAALLAAGAASAATRIDVAAIARESGLSERQVRMVLGTPSGFAEYRTSYRAASHQLRRTLGQVRYEDLVQYARENPQSLAETAVAP